MTTKYVRTSIEALQVDDPIVIHYPPYADGTRIIASGRVSEATSYNEGSVQFAMQPVRMSRFNTLFQEIEPNDESERTINYMRVVQHYGDPEYPASRIIVWKLTVEDTDGV